MSCVVRRLSHFLGWAEGPSCETEAFPERTLVMSKKITTTTPPTDYNKEQGWHTNTELGCDVKTILRSDRKMKVGKEYQGVLRLDSDGIIDEFLCRDPHYTFIETESQRTAKRNPHVYSGQFITFTRRPDGSLRPNFKPIPKIDKNFSVEKYACGVANELLWALEGLIENGSMEEESE